MNRIYRTIWNEKAGNFVAVSELARSCGKKASAVAGAVEDASPGGLLKALAAALLLTFGAPLYALPTDGVVAAGEVAISSTAGSMTVTQSSQNAALNWQSFSIGEAESVQFVQPNSSSVALNRVLGADASNILGTLSSNGQVFLVNPNGILFGQGASVNVGGLVASTLDISDSDLMSGDYRFAGTSDAGVLNQGRINADGGFVALLGANVSNQGVIAARLGTVALAAGEAITLDVAGDGLLNVGIDEGAVNALVANGGMIQADGGQVLLSAQSAGNLLHTVVNNTGVIQAQTIENRDGVIHLLGDMQSGTVNVAGTLDASAPNGGDGGFIDTSAAKVTVADGTQVTTAAAQGLTGSWLIDPTDYTIAATGGDITGAVLSANLANTSITIESISGGTSGAGDVNVNDVVTWNSNTLTLNAQDNINIRANLNAKNSAKLALEFGQGALAAGNTSNFITMGGVVNLTELASITTKQGSDGAVKSYYVIRTLGTAGSANLKNLQGMNGNLTVNYALGADIDASATSTWNGGEGFLPIGDSGTPYTGTFNGLGHTISNLTINRPATVRVGLFGEVGTGGSVQNIGLVGGSVASDSWGTGSLVGVLGGSLINSYATGSVYGFHAVGGLVGVMDGGAIVDSHATGDVVGGPNGEAGGLVGLIWGAPRGTVTNSYATGNVSSEAGNVGGLVGINWGTVTGSYATGTANGTDYIGGLIGNNSQGSIVNSYATGAASGNNRVGGLAGNNSTSIINSYATGAVSGSTHLGGLVGANDGSISNSYAIGTVTGSGDNVGGLAGSMGYGTISNSYATGAVTSTAGGKVGGLVGGAGGGGYGYGYGYGGGGAISNSYATGAVSGVSQVGGLLGDNLGGITVSNSFWNTTTSGQTTSAGGIGMTTANMQTQANFTSATAANGNVDPAWDMSNTWVMYEGHTSPLLRSFMTALTVTAADATKTYDGLAYSGSNGVTYSTTPDGNLLGTLSYSGTSQGARNAGNYAITGSGLYSNQQGYIIGYVAGALTVNKAALTLSTDNVTKTYDGGLSADGAATVTSGALFGGDTLAGGTFAFTDKNAGAGNKTVTTSAVTVSDGNGGGNYAVTYADNTSSTISPYAVSLSGSRVYDGTADMAAAALAIGDLVGTETLTLSGSGTVADKHVANGKTVTLGSLALADGTNGGVASNYTFAGGAQAADITQAALTLSTSDVTKTYDGGTTASSTATVSGGTLFAGDSLSGGSFAYTDKNAGDGNKTVTASGVAVSDGNDGDNYSISYVDNITSTIDPYAVSLTGSRVYDGDTAVEATSLSLGTLIGSETLGLSGTGAVADKHVADAKTLTLGSLALADGTDGGVASNYTFTGGTHTADITQASLTLTTGDVSKVYDGGLSALGTATVSSGTLFDTDTISGGSFAYSDKNAGVGDKIVTLSGVTVSDGNDGGNYNISYADNTSSTISQASLILSGTRSYDGSSAVAGSVLSAAGVAGESFAVSGTGDASNLASRNIQTGSILWSVTGLSLGASDNGGLAGNYRALSTIGSAVDITQAALTLTTSDVTKIYDGDLSASGTATISTGTLFGSDTISGGSFAYTDKNAGTGNKSVTTTGVTVSDGNEGGNYNISYVDNTSSTIDAYAVSLTGSRVYDGDTDVAAPALSLGTLVGSETLGLSGTGTVADKHVADAKSVTLGSLTLTDGTNGGVASNYTFTGGTHTADITQASLTLSTGDVSKVYDGGLTASGTATVSSGALLDTDTISGGSFAYTHKNAGAGNKTVTTSGVTVNDGNGGANYTVSYVDNTTSTISRKALSVSGMLAADKAFDGNTAATLSGGELLGLVGAETLEFSGHSGEFADASVGTDKDVSVDGIVLSDGTGLAANYSVSNPLGLTADITAVDTVPEVADINTRLSGAITSATSIDSAEAWADDTDTAISPSGETSGPNTLGGLNLTVADRGLRLPEDVWFGDAMDEEEL